MAEKKPIVTNINPYHADVRHYEGGFTWSFYDRTKGGREKIYQIKFERWWLTYLTRDLRKVIQAEINELKRLRELSGFKDSEFDD